MSDRLVDLMMSGPDENTSWLAVGLPIPHVSHFLVTDFYVKHSHLSDLMEIGAHPALTHTGTGRCASQCLESIEQAAKIAVVLEALPIPWDGTAEEILAGARMLPPALRRWLCEEVCGYPPKETEAR